MTPILQVRMDIAWCCIHTTRFDSCAHIRFISIALSDAASVLPTCHYCQTVVHASDTEYNNRTPDSPNLRRALRRSRPSAAHEQQEKLVQGLLTKEPLKNNRLVRTCTRTQDSRHQNVTDVARGLRVSLRMSIRPRVCLACTRTHRVQIDCSGCS